MSFTMLIFSTQEELKDYKKKFKWISDFKYSLKYSYSLIHSYEALVNND